MPAQAAVKRESAKSDGDVERPSTAISMEHPPATTDTVTTYGAAAVIHHDRENPSYWDTMRADPTLPVCKENLEILIRDQQRWTRRYLMPIARFFSLRIVALIVALKRLLPFQFSWHSGIDVLCLWFCRRFVSADAMHQLMRHFVVETNLENFILDNCGAEDVQRVELRPQTLPDMAKHTVIQHDLNVFNFIIDMGCSKTARLHKKDLTDLNFSSLRVHNFALERDRFRWMNIDIATSLYFMNIPFCLFTTEAEYERAVNSFQMDETLCNMLAAVTGDDAFRSYTPLKFAPFLNLPYDVPRDLFKHCVVNEFAHERLRLMERAKDTGATAWPQ